MSLQLIETESFPTYNDDRVFDWEDYNYYMTLGEYSVMHRYGDIWEVFYCMGNPECQRLSSGSKEFCMKSVEHEIRQSEL